MTFGKWAFQCKGPARKGASRVETENSLHVWKRREDGMAFCKRCALELDASEAADCFRQW